MVVRRERERGWVAVVLVLSYFCCATDYKVRKAFFLRSVSPCLLACYIYVYVYVHVR